MVRGWRMKNMVLEIKGVLGTRPLKNKRISQTIIAKTRQQQDSLLPLHN